MPSPAPASSRGNRSDLSARARSPESRTSAPPNANETDGPFLTFEFAREFVQTINKTGLDEVTIQFRDGTYFLPATENFTAADSGTADTEIVYENYPRETPIISGGTRA